MTEINKHVIYDNFYLANEVEDQFNSHLNLQSFVKVDNTLVGTPGMAVKVNVYSATDGTEELAMGEGNSKAIEVKYADKEYRIKLAQNKFGYYDEQAMTDPMLVPVGMKHAGTDLYNHIQADIFAEFNKATQTVEAEKLGFDAFVDATALLNSENIEGENLFAFVSPKDMADLRKELRTDLLYVEAFAKQGYVGTVAGINVYTKKDAEPGTVIIADRNAVTLFNKRGVEVEQERDANVRNNEIYTRKYYLVALTDETKAVKITTGAGA